MKLETIKKHAGAFIFGMLHPVISINNACVEIKDVGIKNTDKETIAETAGAAVVIGIPCAVYLSMKHKIDKLYMDNILLKVERDTCRIKNQVAYEALKAITEDRELTETEKEVVEVCDAWQSLDRVIISKGRCHMK